MAKINLTDDELDDITHRARLNDWDVEAAYSGRGMFGETCLAFRLDAVRQLGRLCIAIHQTLDAQRCEQMLGNLRLDSFGLGSVVYFPAVSHPAEVAMLKAIQ